MEPVRVIKALDVGEDLAASLVERGKNAAFDELGLKAGKEALGLGVVVAVALARHRLPETASL